MFMLNGHLVLLGTFFRMGRPFCSHVVAASLFSNLGQWT
jgi:hypothetical protein